MTIRFAQDADVRAIAEVHVASAKAAYQHLFPAKTLEKLTVVKREQAWQQILSEHQTTTFVLEEVERIIGFANVGTTRDKDKDAEVTGEISSIYLVPQYWGQGYGQKLCEAAITYLWRAGFQEVTLWVLEGNQRARRFYEKMGFAFDGTLKVREKEKQREVRYAKELG